MRKIKSNAGITLPFTVVIVFFIALLVSAIVGMIALSVKLGSYQHQESEQKIILENVMYDFLNILKTEYEPNDEFIDYLDKYMIKSEENEDGNELTIELKSKEKYPNIILRCVVDIEIDGEVVEYSIKKWGFV